MPGLDAVLVLPGARTPHELELRHLAAELGIEDRVRFPEWLDQAELEGLYRMAACFCLPSLEEGFGLPVLEAMARGVPVCCSDASSLPEVVGTAGLLFDPREVSSIRASGGASGHGRERGAGAGKAGARAGTGVHLEENRGADVGGVLAGDRRAATLAL